MKRTAKLNWFIAVLLSCMFSQQAISQTLKDFFATSEVQVTYLGVDFTKAKLINYPNPNPIDIKERIYNSINDVVVNEPKKYDLISAFHKTNIISDLTAVRATNGKINSEEIVSSNTADFNRLKESDISAVAKGLDLSGKKGFGVLIVMEGMKKSDKEGEASMWVAIIDMGSKKVLLTDRFESRATGFGFRNYWASTIKITLDAIEKKKYKEWKEKSGS
jgi:hypothetical protein